VTLQTARCSGIKGCATRKGNPMQNAIDATTVAIVRDVVDSLVQGQKMFSAWEVAVIAHKRRGADTARKLMKEEVHSYYNENNSEFSDTYDKTLVSVGGGRKAFIFHGQHDNPDNYQPLDRGAVDPDVRIDVGTSHAAPAAVPVVSVDPIVDDEDEEEEEDSDNINTDRFGRIRIPAQVLKEYGIRPGDMLNLGVDTLAQVTVISKNDPQSISGAFRKTYQYKVDQYNNMRIGGSRLPNRRQNGTFKIESQNDQLLVSPKD